MRTLASIASGFIVSVALGVTAQAAALMSPADLHRGPGEAWPIIAQIPAGASIDFVNCGPGWVENWCHVKYKGKEGYVNANTRAPSDAGDNVVVAPVVTTNAAYMRKGPGQGWAVVGALMPGSEVNVQNASAVGSPAGARWSSRAYPAGCMVRC